MGEVDKVQDRIKADLEAIKEKMATMMEAIMSMKKIMEVNAAAIVATSAIAEVDLTPPSSLNQINHAISDMVGETGKELGSMGGPLSYPNFVRGPLLDDMQLLFWSL